MWQRDPNSEWGWKFKLLYAEALLRAEDRDGARDLLKDQPPASFSKLQPRYQYLKAFVGLWLFDTSATGLLKAAIDAARAQLDVATEADSLILLAGTDGQPDPEAIAQQALDLSRKYRLEYQEANALNEIGLAALSENRCGDAAVQPFSQAIALAKKIGAIRVETTALANLGECYYELGDLDRSRRSYAEARPLLFAADHTALAVNVNRELGTLYSLMQEDAKALEYYRSAFTIAQFTGGISRRYITSALDLAGGSLQVHDLEAAEKYNNLADRALRQAIKEGRPRGVELTAECELNRADIAAERGKLRDAEALYRQVLQLLPKSQPDPMQWSAFARLAEVEEHLSKVPAARRDFEKAIETIESNRSRQKLADYQIKFLSALIRFYQQYVDFLLRQKDQDTALAVADSSRASVLTQNLISDRTQPDFAAKIQKQARATNSALLFYWLAPTTSYVWAITPAGTFCKPLPRPQTEIEQDVRSYQAFIQEERLDLLTPANALAMAVGTRLYDTLIGPVAAYLTPGMRVVIVPDGALHGLNFETLLVKSGKLHYWLDDRTVTVAPSLGILLTRSKSKPPSTRALIVGDPSYKGTEFQDLPASGTEVERVRSLFPNGSRVLTQQNARADSYKQAQPWLFSLVHFSAHVEADTQSPLDSAIILSPSGKGMRLYARDVMSTPLNADLVTVSGCRSSGSAALSGEGMVGFAWAAFQAGARNAVTSLWAVDDESTADLMDHFYRGVNGGKPYAEALREAKRQLSDTNPKPYYWAPFQLYSRNIGDDGRPAHPR
jgi:CHAT domain-containing protein